MSISRIKIDATRLYIIAWLFTQFGVLLASTEFVYISNEAIKIRFYLYAISGLLLMFKVFFFDRYRMRTLFAIAFILLLIGAISYHTLGVSLILHGAFLVSIKSVDLKRLVKADMAMRILFLVILFALSSSGIIYNYRDIISGRERISFGWLHPNVFGGHAITILVEYYYAYVDRISLKLLAFFLVYTAVLWHICASRTSIYSFLILILIVQLFRLKRIEKSRLVEYILKLIVIFCATISWIFVWLYYKGTVLGNIINNSLSSRLTYSLRFLKRYPITLLGEKIYTVSTREHIRQGIGAEIFDMIYIRMFIEYGLVFSILFLIIYTYLQYSLVNRGMIKESIIVLFFSLIGIANTGLLSPFSNISLMFFALVWGETCSV